MEKKTINMASLTPETRSTVYELLDRMEWEYESDTITVEVPNCDTDMFDLIFGQFE